MSFYTVFGFESDQTQSAPVAIKQEREIVVYAKITNFDGLHRSKRRVYQEQYTLKSESGSPQDGAVRVRKTIDGNQVTYEQTVKAKVGEAEQGIQNSNEESVPIGEPFFTVFKGLSAKRMVKDRYYFPFSEVHVKHGENTSVLSVPDSFFEVDVFHKADGSLHEWCKIDIELGNLEKALANFPEHISRYDIRAVISSLPFKPIEYFTESLATESQKKVLSDLYTNVFLTENK